MIPAPVTDEMVRQFGHPLAPAVKRTFIAEDPTLNIAPCDAIVERASDDRTAVMRVPLHLEPGELSRLLNGGQVWVSMWGGLSPFAVEVVGGDSTSTPNAQKSLHVRETEALDRLVP